MKRFLRWAGLALLLLAGAALADAWFGLGHRATGERLARMKQSPQWHDGEFQNPAPIVNHFAEGLESWWKEGAHASPEKTPLTLPPVDATALKTPPASGLRITWFGHSSTLVEVDGARVLTDPFWSDRAGPVTWAGPERWYPPPVALEDLGPIDAVLISHDHYDHMDHRTLIRLKDSVGRFVVPLGGGAHLEYWGIPKEKILEVDWWDSLQLGALEVVSTPVRHATGRQVLDRDATLWTSYVLKGPQHRVWYSGDTGLFTALEDIDAKYGPFDVTMIEVGQYNRGWPDWHLGPEQAVTAHRKLHGKVFFPIHWGLLNLAPHPWTEPIERALTAARQQHVSIVTPRPGQSVEPGVDTDFTPWWPKLETRTAEEDPIVSGEVHFTQPLE